jgi:tetratricopeptide (TPR) repeat protein
MSTYASRIRPIAQWVRRAVAMGLLSSASAALGQVPAPYAVTLAASAFAQLLIPLVMVSLWGLDEFRMAGQAADRNDWAWVEGTASKQLRRLAEKRERQGAEGSSADDVRDSEQRWLLMRAYARQRMGRYAEALADYRAATDFVERPDFSIELNRGICEMVLGRWGEAEHLMLRLAEREPQRWEPQYNLGVIRSITGDKIGAQLALERLRPLNGAMADALDEQYVSRLPTSADATRPESDAPSKASEALGRELTRALAELPVFPSGDLGVVSAPGRLAHPRLAIDGRAIALPPGEWVLASRREYRIRGTIAGSSPQSSEGLTFPALAGSAFLLGNGELRAIVKFASHRALPSYETIFFGPESCSEHGAFVTGRLGYETRKEEPGTCAYARRLETPAASNSEDVHKAHALALAMGARIPLGWYEFHYTGYRRSDLPYTERKPRLWDERKETYWSAQVLWPATALAGDLVAVDWLTAFPFRANPVRARGDESASIGWVGP